MPQAGYIQSQDIPETTFFFSFSRCLKTRLQTGLSLFWFDRWQVAQIPLPAVTIRIWSGGFASLLCVVPDDEPRKGVQQQKRSIPREATNFHPPACCWPGLSFSFPRAPPPRPPKSLRAKPSLAQSNWPLLAHLVTDPPPPTPSLQ